MLLKDVKLTVLGLHDLLSNVYGDERRISDILLKRGLTIENVNLLKTERIVEFYENIRFTLTCRFFHYSGGQRLLSILYRRYGLFDHPKETLEEIGNCMNISRERVRQLQNKAIKRLIGGVSVDAVGILIALAACKTLDIDPMDFLCSEEIEQNTDNTNNKEFNQDSSDLPNAKFYIQGSFDYTTKRGYYQLLMMFGDYKKYFDKQDLEGHSDVSMILLAAIEGLEKLKKPCTVVVRSNTIFGISSIYKKGKLREI